MSDLQTDIGSARPANVLVVDDSAMMRAMIKRVISLADVPIAGVFEAANGREAIEILSAHAIDVIFTDVNMPIMTGPELLREMARQPQWSRILRVVVSTDGSEARRAEMTDLNVRLYVEKPFRPEVMRDVLSQIASATCR
jgi:two-component system, chemotaxis family, chemotaxis protein CheY